MQTASRPRPPRRAARRTSEPLDEPSEWPSGQLPPGYTIGMKTAVSLPNEVFHGAERYAKRTRKSRSQLYAEALSEYLARHAPDEVTEDMNAVVRRLGESGTDPFVEAATRRALKKVEW